MAVRLPSALLALALALAACGSDPAPTISVTATPTSLKSGEAVTLNIAVTDFELVDDAGRSTSGLRAAHEGHEDTSETARRGHYHVYLDTTEENPLYMGHIAAPRVTVTASVGPHVLIVRLQDEAHRIITPEIKATAAITVIP